MVEFLALPLIVPAVPVVLHLAAVPFMFAYRLAEVGVNYLTYIF